MSQFRPITPKLPPLGHPTGRAAKPADMPHAPANVTPPPPGAGGRAPRGNQR